MLIRYLVVDILSMQYLHDLKILQYAMSLVSVHQPAVQNCVVNIMLCII